MKTGIIGAVSQEVELLIAELQENDSPVRVVRRASLEFHEGRIGESPVVVVCCGVGKVNAALCAQILICDFGVGVVINTGAAGGVAEKLAVLDMVVCTDAVQHDFNATVFGYKLGQIPGRKSAFFPGDLDLRKKALASFGRVSLGFKSPSRMIPGRIATGDVFVSDAVLRNEIVSAFSPACVEMEGAAVAQVCAINEIPFLILRSISDLAGHEANMSYSDFSKEASHRSAAVLIDILKNK